MAQVKLSVVEMKAEKKCLALAFVIIIAKVTNDPNSKAKNLSKVRELLKMTCIYLSRGGGIPELQAFQEHISEYRIVVYSDR